MNTRLFFALIFFAAANTFAQKIEKSEVPIIVVNTFNKMYPGIEVTSWELHDNNYFAEAELGGLHGKAEFSQTGTWLVNRYPQKIKHLPSSIISFCKENRQTDEIISAYYGENNKEENFYQVVIMQVVDDLNEEFELYFSQTGQFIKSIGPDGEVYMAAKEGIDDEVAEDVVEPEKTGKRRKKKKKKKKEEGSENKPSHRISESEVPAIVKKYQLRKFPHTTNVTWDTLNKNYIANFVFREVKTHGEFLPNGTLIQTKTECTKKTIYPLVLRYLEKNHAPYKIIYAEKNVRKDRNNNYYVKLSKRVKGKKLPLVWELFFDKSGRITKEIEPDELYDDGLIVIIDKTEEGYQKILSEETILEVNADELINQEVKPKDLPTQILKYVEKKMTAYKVKKAFYEKDDKLGYIYHVFVQIEGINQPTSELFFTANGKLLKKIDDGVEDDSIHMKEEEEKISIEAPEKVSATFTKKYADADEIIWEEDGGNYLVNYVIDGYECKSIYTPESIWLSTAAQINPEKLYAPIKRIIISKYKGYKITFAEKTTKKNRKGYYYVEVFSKKKNPPSVELYFNRAGKLLKEKPE